VRQFRYYLVSQDLPRVALRFLDAIRRTIEDLRKHPHIGPRYDAGDSRLQNLRSWPVTGFEAIRVYYIPDDELIRVIRVLHGKRDVKQVLKSENDV
jgi:toxin ParE1/3/4